MFDSGSFSSLSFSAVSFGALQQSATATGVSIAAQLLVANAALLAVVPAIRIMAGVLPVTTDAPAISLTQVSGVERKTVSMAEATRYKTDRVQVTIYAKTYPAVKQILALVRDAMPVSTVAAGPVQSVLHANDGPCFFDEGPNVFSQSVDYMTSYTG